MIAPKGCLNGIITAGCCFRYSVSDLVVKHNRNSGNVKRFSYLYLTLVPPSSFFSITPNKVIESLGF